MGYLNKIYESYGTRKSDKEKETFRDYILSESKNKGYEAKVCNVEGHNNVIIGNLENAKVVFTAHYDTPAGFIIPNIMMPTNRVLFFIYQFLIPIIMVVISILPAYFISKRFELDRAYMLLIFLLIYYLLFFIFYKAIKNPKNKNDNTSGVAGVMEILSKIDKNSDKVAFILFDDEEKGKKGSKALNKSNPNLFLDKLIINMDCIGNGNNIIGVVKDKAKELKEYKLLEEAFKDNDSFNVKFYSDKKASCNSDQKSFPVSVGLVACKKNKLVGYYTPRIHTMFDTVAYEENIEYISESLKKFVDNLEQNA